MSAMATPLFKFVLPDQCRSFTLFPRLPVEIRHKIWEAYLSEPGINFVKLQVCNRVSRSSGAYSLLCPVELGSLAANQGLAGAGTRHGLDAFDLMVIQMDHQPSPLLHAVLVAQSPNRKADVSRCEAVHRQLAVLAQTCVESASLVKSLVLRHGVLRLQNSRIVALDGSPDLVVLDYLPTEIYHYGCTLDIGIFCLGLELIRRVAVRFSHSWRPCHHAISSSDERADTDNYPIHLYQFLARCLPSLEEFYFIDYFMVPKQEEAQLPCYGGGSSARHDSRIMPVFRAKDRRFSQVVKGEASASRWKVEADVFTILGWLQDRFVRYANVSLTSRHKNPEKVRFGVLACDWNIVPPVTRTRPSVKSAGKRRLKRSQGQTRVSVGRRPRRFQPLSKPDLASRSLNDAEAARVLGSDSRNEVRGPTRDNTGASAQADKRGEVSVFEFGAGPVSAFDFTFRQPHGSLAPWSGL